MHTWEDPIYTLLLFSDESWHFVHWLRRFLPEIYLTIRTCTCKNVPRINTNIKILCAWNIICTMFNCNLCCLSNQWIFMASKLRILRIRNFQTFSKEVCKTARKVNLIEDLKVPCDPQTLNVQWNPASKVNTWIMYASPDPLIHHLESLTTLAYRQTHYEGTMFNPLT